MEKLINDENPGDFNRYIKPVTPNDKIEYFETSVRMELNKYYIGKYIHNVKISRIPLYRKDKEDKPVAFVELTFTFCPEMTSGVPIDIQKQYNDGKDVEAKRFNLGVPLDVIVQNCEEVIFARNVAAKALTFLINTPSEKHGKRRKQ